MGASHLIRRGFDNIEKTVNGLLASPRDDKTDIACMQNAPDANTLTTNTTENKYKDREGFHLDDNFDGGSCEQVCMI